MIGSANVHINKVMDLGAEYAIAFLPVLSKYLIKIDISLGMRKNYC